MNKKTQKTRNLDLNLDLNMVVNSLPPIMRDMATTLKEKHSVPMELALSVVIAAANIPVATTTLVDTKQFGIIPTSLYIMPLVESGGRKSTTMKDAFDGMNQYAYEVWVDLVKRDRNRYDVEKSIYDSDLRKYKAAVSKQQPMEMPDPPRPALLHKILVERTTTNGIVTSLKTLPFISVATDEATLFFSGHSNSNSNSKMEFVGQLTQLWNEGRVTRNTGVDQETYRNRAITFLGMAQPGAIAHNINDATLASQGIWNRFLIVNVPPFDVEELYGTINNQHNIHISKFSKQFQKLMESVKWETEDSPRYFELKRNILNWDEESHQFLIQYGTRNNRLKNSHAREYGEHDGFISRLTEQMIRLTATVCVFRGGQTITIDDAIAGMCLAEWFWIEKQNLNLVSINSTNGIAEKLLEFIRRTIANKPDTKINRTFLGNYGPAVYRNLNLKERSSLIAEMVRNDLLVQKIEDGVCVWLVK